MMTATKQPTPAQRALLTWNGEGEPEGWYKHAATGRRRPEGDASQEYIAEREAQTPIERVYTAWVDFEFESRLVAFSYSLLPRYRDSREQVDSLPLRLP